MNNIYLNYSQTSSNVSISNSTENYLNRLDIQTSQNNNTLFDHQILSIILQTQPLSENQVLLLASSIDNFKNSSTLEELFTFKFKVALDLGLISLTKYKQDTNCKDIDNTDTSKVFGFDFVDHEHPSISFLKSILCNNKLLQVKYIKYCNYLNRLVFHIILYQEKLKKLILTKLPIETQDQILKLNKLVIRPSSIFYRYSLLSTFKFTTKKLIEFLSFLLVDIKIDIDYDHFKHIIGKNNTKELELLIRHATNVDIKGGDFNNTPLIFAADKGHLDCLLLLIENKANVGFRNIFRQTALMVAAEQGHSDCVLKLIESKAKINCRDNFGYTALMWAAEKGHLDCLRLLIENNANLDLKNNYGKTALMFAVFEGHSSCLKILIDNNANINCIDGYGCTALMYAVKYGHLDCLSMLIENNSILDNLDENGCTALIYAAHYGYSDCLFKLIEHGANLNVKNKDGTNVLMYAALYGHSDCISVVIDNINVKIDSQNNKGRTALMLAAKRGQSYCLFKLIENKVDLDLKENNGMTALMLAASKGHLDCLLKLIESGSLNLLDNQGRSALDYAKQKGNQECINLLTN